MDKGKEECPGPTLLQKKIYYKYNMHTTISTSNTALLYTVWFIPLADECGCVQVKLRSLENTCHT